MKVIGIAGWSGSGKTTLIVRLIPHLAARGLRVSTVKHAHHRFDIDKPGKDSHRHREAGAAEVLVASGRRWALIHEIREEPEPSLDELLAHLSPVDLVLVEGFKRHAHDRIEVRRADHSDGPALWTNDPGIVALATDRPAEVPDDAHGRLTVLDLDDVEAIADFVVRHLALDRPGAGSSRPAVRIG